MCEILAPQSRIKPKPPALEGKVLTTVPPEKSLSALLLSSHLPKKKMRYLSQNIRLGKLCCSKSSNHVLIRNINSGFASFAFLVLCSIIFKRQKVVRREGWFNKISLNSLVEFHRAV